MLCVAINCSMKYSTSESILAHRLMRCVCIMTLYTAFSHLDACNFVGYTDHCAYNAILVSDRIVINHVDTHSTTSISCHHLSTHISHPSTRSLCTIQALF